MIQAMAISFREAVDRVFAVESVRAYVTDVIVADESQELFSEREEKD